MAQRRGCLAALSGRKYGASRRVLLTAYIGYIRAKADYGASIFMNHAAPSSVNILEVEQRACGRIITGCTRGTRVQALEAEEDL